MSDPRLLMMKNAQPGPDHYRPSTSIQSRNTPSYTIQKKYTQKEKERQPGPCEYTVTEYQSIKYRPSSKMGRELKNGVNITTITNGPAQFNL